MKELEDVVLCLKDVNRRLEALEARQIDPDKPMTVQEAAEFLSISMSYLYRLTYQHKIPFHKPTGKLIYFIREELQKWIAGKKTNHRGHGVNHRVRRVKHD